MSGRRTLMRSLAGFCARIRPRYTAELASLVLYLGEEIGRRDRTLDAALRHCTCQAGQRVGGDPHNRVGSVIRCLSRYGMRSSAETTLPVQPGTFAQVQRSLTASISIRPRPLSSFGSARSGTGALGISSQTSISTRTPSVDSRSTTTGNPASPYRGRPSGPVDARTALVTSSLTISSAVSARPRRPHSVSTARVCRRAHGVAVRKAPSGKELHSGHGAVTLRRSVPVSGLSVTAPSRIALRAYPPCADRCG